nr:MAG TPA_asm: hypothetical protein [Caudoviricetes sp.]DAY87786.1 MAG TPA: hypothetical protein [Caudoviricetes sp.]
MCATSNFTLSNRQRNYCSLYVISFTPLNYNLGLPRIRYSFLCLNFIFLLSKCYPSVILRDSLIQSLTLL